MTQEFTHYVRTLVAVVAGMVLSGTAQAQTVSQTPSSGFTQGVTCSPNGALGYNGNSFVACASGAWSVQPITIGTASSAPATCSSTVEGMLYFDTGSTAVKYCNGTSWVLASSGGGSGTVNSGTQYQMGYYPTSAAAISGDANITTDASNDLLVLGGTLAIGTTTVTNAINIIGTGAETIGMVRGTGIGNNLTVKAGGGLSGGTDKTGGNLILSSGIATGTQTSNVQVQVYPAAATTGSSDNTATTAMTISETGSVTGGTGSFGNLVTTLQPTAASGTDKNGATLNLASGVSTGTGSSNINFNVYASGGTGSFADPAITVMTIAGAGVGIGTTVPDASLSFGPQGATIDVVRAQLARGSPTAGANLQIQAGGASNGGTDLAGGNLILSSGISTGTHTSNVQVQVYPAAASTSTSDNAATTAMTISETGTVTGGTGSFGNLATTLQSTTASGTDKNGSTLTLASGVSTGTGSSSMNFKVYGAGSTGTTANAATTAMTIASTGNVGVGSPSPQGTLDVEGGTAASGVAGSSINIVAQNAGGSAGNSGGSITLTTGTGAGGWPSGNVTMNLGSGNAGAFGINRSGNDSYTTTGANWPYRHFEYSNGYSATGNTSIEDYIVRNSSTNQQYALFGAVSVAGSSVYSPALVWGNTPTNTTYAERMRLDQNGVLGIGTSTMSSSNLLEVNGATSIGYPDIAAPSNGLIVSGNVGIGTTAPQSELQVNGGEVQIGSSGASCASNTAGAIRYSSGSVYYCNSSAWTSLGGGSVTGSQYQMAYLSATNTAIGDANITTDSSNDLLIASGSVGIGTTTPLDALSIGTAPIGSTTHALVNLSNTALSGASSSGTYLGANAPSGHFYDFINFQNNNNTEFKVSNSGTAYAASLELGFNSNYTIDSNWGVNINGGAQYPTQINAPLMVGYTASGATYTLGDAYISNAIGIGTTTVSQALTVNGNIDAMGSNNAYLMEIPNSSPATVVNKLAKLNTGNTVTIGTSGDVDGMIGVVVGNAGTTGNAQIALGGQTGCVFDGTPTGVGDFVTLSSSTGGDCHDSGTAIRSSVTSQIIGRVLSTTAISGSTYPITVALEGAVGGGVPNGAIAAFTTTSCPTGWTLLTNSTGRFLRGYDPTASVDPLGSSRGAIGSTEADAMQGHDHSLNMGSVIAFAAGSGPEGTANSSQFRFISPGSNPTVGSPTTDGTNGTPRTSTETRPVNVSVLFCQYAGGNPLTGVTASGTTNYVARWTSSAVIGTGTLYDNGSNVSVGTSALGSMLNIYGGTSIGTSYVATAAPTNGAIIQGNVGIGTNNPLDKFVVHTGTDQNFAVFSGAAWSIPGNGIAMQSLNDAASASEPLSIEGSALNLQPLGGNVGIGITNPNHVLYVNGPSPVGFFLETTPNNGVYAEFANGTTAIYCNAGAAGGCNADTTWTATSDARLKTNVNELPTMQGLDAIVRLRPITYPWKDAKKDKEFGRQIGFLAQEVENIFPNEGVVSTGEATTITLPDGTSQTINDTKTLSYETLVVPLVKAVQQLKAAFDGDHEMVLKLKADNDNLRRRNDEMQREIDDLRRHVHAQ